MLNINNKDWEKLRFYDIQKLLASDDSETMFFEYKNDQTSTRTFVDEVCAFANTYGGYILLGVENDKKITGCTQWSEQKIHTTLHDSITPTPAFDVRKFKTEAGTIFVVRVEEGTLPPYITSRGKILQRVSSGSFTVKDSYALTQMFNKRKVAVEDIGKKISIEEMPLNDTMPDNLCAYLDLGFVPSFHDVQKIKRDFFDLDLQQFSETVHKTIKAATISRLGFSLLITTGGISANQNGKTIAVPAGISNFIEIMCDGSVRCRVCFALENNTSLALVSQTNFISSIFATYYKAIWGDKFYKNFISAEKYEKLVVIKQFSPTYDINRGSRSKTNALRSNYHRQLFGGNIIVTSNRIPKTDYLTIDRAFFNRARQSYNNENLIQELFWTEHYDMGLFSDQKSGFSIPE